MVDWNDRDSALTQLEIWYATANTRRSQMYDQALAMNIHAASSEWQEAFGHCREAFNKCQSAFNYMIGYIIGGERNYAILHWLDKFTIAEAEEFVLSWDDIIAAWAESPLEGRMFTVLSIDTMRKQIWDEPISSFELAGGGGFGL